MRIEASKGGAAVLGGLGLGAALMYFFDPAQGRRRRRLVLDKVSRALSASGNAIGTTASDVRHRARGVVAETRSRMRGSEVSDDVLVDRVRSAIGRVVSHPSSIIVTANSGRVIVSGPVLAREVANLLARARAVHGVHEVENRLEVHETADGVSGLQGGATRRSARLPFMRRNWPPAIRFIAGTTGVALVTAALLKRGGMGAALGVAGAALVARSATERDFGRLVGVRQGRRAVRVQKTINIGAPVEQVFDFFSEFENYPQFMSHIREVHDLGGGRTHWVVDGPAGTTVEWDAVTTTTVPNELIAWQSIEGTGLAHQGEVRFEPASNRGTRVTVRMSYTPPGGLAGHAAATLLGANPKRELNDDLARVKTSLETGRGPRDAAGRGREGEVRLD
jgi:uncharacterized membrane protein